MSQIPVSEEQPIDATTPDYPPVSPRSLLTASYCYAIAPMALGLTSLAAFYITRSGLFAFAGISVFGLGMVSIAMAVLCLFKYLKHSNSNQVHIIAVPFLLLLNFPVAGVCVFAGAEELMKTYVPLQITNNSHKTITDLDLSTPSGHVRFKNLVTGKAVERSIDASHGGTLSVSGLIEGKPFSIDIRDWEDDDAASSDKHGIQVLIKDGGQADVVPPN